MQKSGLSNIVVSSVDVAGRTTTVHAFIAPVQKENPPNPSSPPTFMVFFVAAGDGAKNVRDALADAWDKLAFL